MAGTVGCGGALAVTVGLTVLSGGGFDDSSRSAFVALAGVTLLLAARINGRATVAAARSPLGLTLGALAALCITSAAWTVGEPAASVRWGLTIAGYGAVFVAAAAFTQTAGPRPLAVAIVAFAAVEAVLGLHALASHALPEAEPIGGLWRPGGTFEYSPALAILQVGAIPILSQLLRRGSGLVAGAAAGAAVLVGAVIGLAGSRLAIAGAAVLLILLIASQRSWFSRVASIATGTLVTLGAFVASAVLDGHVPSGATGPGSMGIAKIAAFAVVASGAWLLTRRAISFPKAASIAAAACLTAIALAAVVWAGAHPARATSQASTMPSDLRSRATSQPLRPKARSRSDLLHGRGREWKAALQTWLDHPLLGAGSSAYYRASLPHQRSAPTLYAHDLPLELAAELGVLGLLLGVALYIATAWTIVSASHSPAFWLLAPTVAAFLVSNLVDWTWHLAGLGSLWAAAAGGLSAVSTGSAARDP
jgi:O-antigen ligase